MTSTRTLVARLLGLAAMLAGLTACGDASPRPTETQTQSTPRPAMATAPSAPASTVAPPAAISDQQSESHPRDRRNRRADRSDRGNRAERVDRRVGAAFAAGPVEVSEAQRERLHGRLVEFDGRVIKVLNDDRKGLQHQRFLVAVEGAGTLLIAHNIDLAGHVPVAVGGTVRVHGLFEWNARGGVVHWTHHDPGGHTPGGWIRYLGKTYN